MLSMITLMSCSKDSIADNYLETKAAGGWCTSEGCPGNDSSAGGTQCGCTTGESWRPPGDGESENDLEGGGDGNGNNVDMCMHNIPFIQCKKCNPTIIPEPTLSVTSEYISDNGGRFTVAGNYTTEMSITNNPASWINVTVSGTTATVTVSKNYAEYRNATLTFNLDKTTRSLTVSQSEAPRCQNCNMFGHESCDVCLIEGCDNPKHDHPYRP